jgi:regulator of sirC expression with transglutaminase-like and TPR domain
MKHSEKTDALELFRAFSTRADAKIDLIEGALLIAQQEYPQLDSAIYHGRLDEMRKNAALSIPKKTVAGAEAFEIERIERLNELFYESWGFHGNRENYYDPRNSYLNDVLDRRTGIPITLSVVYADVARGAGLNLAGISMPGHFLVGFANRNDLFIDVFNKGALLTRADCAARMHELRPEIEFRPEYVAPVGPRQILSRMLNNLLGIYVQEAKLAKALAMAEMLVCLDADSVEWIRQRGLIQARLQNYGRAIADIERYLAARPNAPDREFLTQQLALLHQLRARVN